MRGILTTQGTASNVEVEITFNDKGELEIRTSGAGFITLTLDKVALDEIMKYWRKEDA